MAVNNERQCFCCGKTYQYCGHNCKGDNPNEPWRFLFDNENCKTAYDLWQSYRGKEITEDELKKSLEVMNLGDILASNTMVAKDFKKVLAAKKEFKKIQYEKKEFKKNFFEDKKDNEAVEAK